MGSKCDNLHRGISADDHLPVLCGVVINRLMQRAGGHEDVVARVNFNGLAQPFTYKEPTMSSEHVKSGLAVEMGVGYGFTSKEDRSDSHVYSLGSR